MHLLDWYDTLSESRQRLVMLAVTVTILLASTPLNFVHGFLATEEGTAYLRYARFVSSGRAFIAPHQSYYSLIPNIAMLLPARFVPLVTAPWIAVWTAFAVRLYVTYSVSTCEAFPNARMKLYAVVLTVFSAGSAAAPGTIHSQFLIAIAAAAILISNPQQHKIGRTLTLAVAGLEGTVSCVMAPLFVYRAWKHGSATAWLQAGVLSACSVLQIWIVKISLPYSTRSGMHLQPAWVYLDSLFTHLVLLPFLTRAVYHPFSMFLAHCGSGAGVTVAIFAVLCGALLMKLIWGGGGNAHMLALAGLLSVASAVVGMEGGRYIAGGGERYFILGNACVVISLLLAFGKSRPPARRIIGALLIMTTISGVLDIARFWRGLQTPLLWPQQIAAWKQNPSFGFHNDGAVWKDNGYQLAPRPETLSLPYYVFDSNTRPDLARALTNQIGE